MLRPATPLTILLLAAFVLLVISVISTPVVKSIPLASFRGVDYGVFGYCDGTTCSKIEVGYNFAKSFTTSQTGTFDLPTSTRTSLSTILIVHPVAALLTLVMFILAGTAHLHSPSHSPRYLLGLFILSILTFLLTLLSFLVDVLLFIPHMAVGSYLVLAATILIAASSVVSCAMRRTLVSRKARKRRIEQNAEMNGENFYNRQATTAPITPVASNTVIVTGGAGADKLPSFATFEMQKSAADQTSDELIPLTTRTPSDASPNNRPGMGGAYGNTSPPRDQYGNPIPLTPLAPPGMRNPSSDPALNRQYSDPSMAGRGRGMPYRGRGGYPPGRGGYGPPPNGRGGYRGGYGNPNARGGYGPSGPYRGPPGPPVNDGMMAGALGGMAAEAMMRGGRGGPPPGYGRGGYDNRSASPGGAYNQYERQSEGETYGRPPPVGGYTAYNPEGSHDSDSLPRAESPPPLPGDMSDGQVGQAIEMDATTGSPSHPPSGFGTQFGQLRDSDGDITGMVGLQQQRQDASLNRDTITTEGSRYSGDETYVPPRQAWTGAGGSQLNPSARLAELPPGSSAGNKRASGDDYYEDVDPRFAQAAPAAARSNDHLHVQPLALGPMGEEIPPEARSPAGSERSGFTSVSQRGVNPNWNAGHPRQGPPMPTRRGLNPPPPRPDVLTSNPDFEIPGGPRRGKVPGQLGGSGMVPNSAYDGAL